MLFLRGKIIFNLVFWNGREPKYDIREWSSEHDKMGKGLTLSKDELEALKGILEKFREEFTGRM